MTTKITLGLVCRGWRHMMMEFLYEDLRVLRDAYALKNFLSQSDSYGRWVRRVVLPYTSTVTRPEQELPAIEILQLCTNLETLVRPRMHLPESLQFHFDAEQLTFDSLRRIDWWHNNEAERSGGINSLGAVLHNVPNLQYLSIGGVIGNSRVRMDTPIHLPELRTLRLYGSNGLLLHQIVEKWSLPALAHIVLDSPLLQNGLDDIWRTYGSQLQIVEFGKHVRFLLSDSLAPCLRSCPQLTELNYYLFFTAPPDLEGVHKSLTTIGLHASVNALLQDGESISSHIEQHFKVLTEDTFPALRKIVLYGTWRGIISHPRLALMWQGLRNRSFSVEHSGS